MSDLLATRCFQMYRLRRTITHRSGVQQMRQVGRRIILELRMKLGLPPCQLVMTSLPTDMRLTINPKVPRLLTAHSMACYRLVLKILDQPKPKDEKARCFTWNLVCLPARNLGKTITFCANILLSAPADYSYYQDK